MKHLFKNLFIATLLSVPFATNAQTGPQISYPNSTTGTVNKSLSILPVLGSGSDIASCSISPALPGGVSFNNKTCVVSGWPVATLPLTAYTVKATNAAGAVSNANLSLSVAANVPLLDYTSGTVKTVKVGDSVSIVPTYLHNGGSPITSCTVSPALPMGLSLNNLTCVISGTPSMVTAVVDRYVKVTNAIGSVSPRIAIAVVANTPALSYPASTVGTVGKAVSIIPTAIQARGSSITSCTATGLPAGLSINNSTCEISGTPTVAAAAKSYSVLVKNSAGTTTTNVNLTVNSPITAPNLDYAASTGKAGKVGAAMSVTPGILQNGGSPITSCVLSPSSAALPAGLSINNSTCVISGTPTAVNASTVRFVRASNAVGYKDAQVTLSVDANYPVLSYAAKSGTVGQALSISPSTLNARGAAITGCTGTLPAGLSVNNTTCVISGTPTAAAAAKSYSVTVKNVVGSSIASINLTINAAVSSKYGTYENPFSRDSAWNVRPVNPVLDTWEIPKDGMNGQNWYPNISAGIFSTGFYKALASDTPMRVYGKVAKNNLIYDTESEANRAYVEVPRWPKDLVAASGGDGHADLLDTVTGVIHSFWQLKYNDSLQRWEATTWNTTRIDGTGWGTPGKYMGGARAAGVPTSGGILRKHEVSDSQDQFHHVIAMSMAASGLSPEGTGYVYPATNSDWNYATSNYGKIPEGALMMLPANFDLTKLGRAHSRKIAKTLMTYGARVVDANSHTPFAMYVEFGGQWPGHSNGWDNTYANDLDKIRAGMKMVKSQSGWIDKDGKPVAMNPNGNGLNFISLRGDQVVKISETQPSTKAWWKNSGSVLGQYDPIEEKIVWGPTGATPTIQNSSNVGNRVAWAKIVSGAKYRMTVTATNGATINLQLINTDGSVAFQTMYKGQGDLPVEFTGISGTRPRVYAKSGVNVSSSSAKIFVTRID